MGMDKFTLDGVIVIDKPKGWTSNDVVQKVKRIFGAAKAGHTGTLDPLATGVLPVCLNKATKLVDALMDGYKEYEVDIIFGLRTDTYDTEGRTTATYPVPDDIFEKIKYILPRFRGVIKQVPPYFSAVKYEGKPLYYWARRGRFVDLPPREVEIKKLEPISSGKDRMKLRVVCSKGTYIRSLCDDIGQLLGTGAVVAELRRMATGPFTVEKAIQIDKLQKCSDINRLNEYIIGMDKLTAENN